MPVNPPLNRKLRMGLVGGGGGFVGQVHALAATLDDRAILTAAALSSDPARARALAPDFDIAPERAYGSYQEMAAVEARLPPGERIDFVSNEARRESSLP
jgi:predicted dehydrogenase